MVVCLALCVLTNGASTKDRMGDYMFTQSAPQQASQGSLVEFMQQHQQAYQRMQSNPQQVQQSTNLSADQLINALSGEQQAPQPNEQQALVEHQAVAKDDGGEAFGPCKTCVFVLERIKKGTNMLLPAICSELYHKFPDAYALCHQVLNALSINGNNVRYWLFEGCFKYEIYQSKEWIKPCPSHVMCSVLKDLASNPFCPALPMEDPFKDAGAGGGQ